MLPKSLIVVFDGLLTGASRVEHQMVGVRALPMEVCFFVTDRANSLVLSLRPTSLSLSLPLFCVVVPYCRSPLACAFACFYPGFVAGPGMGMGENVRHAPNTIVSFCALVDVGFEKSIRF